MFNIKGNDYQFVARVRYQAGILAIRFFGTHAEYDKVDPRFAGLGQRIPRMAELPADVARVKDFRTVLDRPDIDAVVIATPDHWHAIQTIAACKAGKDVYIEKPLSITIAEGRAMVEAARRHERIVQVGTHRRSSRMYMHLAEVVRSRVLGQAERFINCDQANSLLHYEYRKPWTMA